jgi:hypothetical protein
MKRRSLICLILVLGWCSLATGAWAIDVGWMQKGVRVWYFGAAGSGDSSNAEEAYLFDSIDGENAQVTHHSAISYFASTNPIDSASYPILDNGPCWIHPWKLQNLQSGDFWQGQEIVTVMADPYTYDTFLGEFPSFPYLLLPIKTLFDIIPQRTLIKIVYMIEDESTGIAYFDAETGLLLLRENSTGYVTVFFFLSEINYDFAGKTAFAEDNGPHTGFRSSAIKSRSIGHIVQIESYVESRYGSTVQMWTSTQAGGSISSFLPIHEHYCFFGSGPVLRHILMSDSIPPPSNYPPEDWDEYGQYLWWWVPKAALQGSSINIFDVSMSRTSTSPYTFAGTGGTGLYFSEIIFNNDGYMTSFTAKDPAIGLDTSLGNALYNDTTVRGLEYYSGFMGTAIPDTGPLPAATTGTAGSITSSSAALNGTVNPNGTAATAYFAYGLNTDYGNIAPVTLSPSDGSVSQNISATISNLQPNTTYQYRLIATNGMQTVYGDNLSLITSASNNDNDTNDGGDDGGGGGGGGGGIFGAISINDVIGYHLDGITKNGTRIYMPVTNGFKALKGAQTHIEKFAPTLAHLIRGGFESLERRAEANKEGFLYRIGTYVYPILGKIAELYLDAVDSQEFMTNAYSGTMIGVNEFNKLYQQGIAVSPHIVKGTEQ